MSLRTLLSNVRNCSICAEQLPEGPRPIVQVHTAAKILIAGQAPGRKVHKSGIPFDDPSGNRLREWLGVSTEEFYDEKKFAILPMGFCFPGTGKSGDFPPRRECAPAWRQALLDELPEIQLTLVIGQYAQKYHIPGQSGNVTELVRNWRQTWPHTVPLPHPSPRNNRWLKNNTWFAQELIPELQKLVQVLLCRQDS